MGQDIRVVIPNEFDFLRPTSTDRPLPVQGLDKLIQIVTKALLTNPGRDIFNPEYGAGLRDALPVRAHQATESGAVSDVTIALLRVEADVKRFQQEEGNTAAERLSSLSLQTLEFDAQNAQWFVEIELVSEEGQAAKLPVVI